MECLRAGYSSGFLGSALIGDATGVPLTDKSFDTVLLTEVLEHVDEPLRVLEETRRIAQRWVLVSVPREPLWRGLNMMRMKYLGQLGNTPDHRNHWSRSGILTTLRQYYRVKVVRCPVPWTVCLCEVT